MHLGFSLDSAETMLRLCWHSARILSGFWQCLDDLANNSSWILLWAYKDSASALLRFCWDPDSQTIWMNNWTDRVCHNANEIHRGCCQGSAKILQNVCKYFAKVMWGVCRDSPEIMQRIPRIPQDSAGRVQGWESVCWRVLGNFEFVNVQLKKI